MRLYLKNNFSIIANKIMLDCDSFQFLHLVKEKKRFQLKFLMEKVTSASFRFYRGQTGDRFPLVSHQDVPA